MEQCPMPSEQTLSQRLGLTTHVSPLDHHVRAMAQAYPSNTAATIEDWLVDVANARGARIVLREPPADVSFQPPPETALDTEDLVAAICLLQRRDRPQMFRLAAQFITREVLDIPRLIRLARRERIEVVLGEMARQALRVEGRHPAWQALAEAFPAKQSPRSPVIHWQRLAWPVMSDHGPNAQCWQLVR